MRRGEAELRRRFERLRRFDAEFDFSAWSSGRLAGVDEAGVGPLAGPVVAAAVILPADFDVPEVFDSKQMTARQRARCAAEIRARAISVAVSRVSPQRIDRLNVARAMRAAHRHALGALSVRPDAVIVDGRFAPRPPAGFEAVRVQAVVRGDALSLAVAAASVVAKVSRDRIMLRLDRRYPGYGFARHKGYGTLAHREALRRLGLSPVHRRCFCSFLEAEAAAALQATLEFPAPT